jgi:ferredoxin--NADP+ reductase
MLKKPIHIVAVIGGAVAGSIAAAMLAEQGYMVVVFEQGPRPYGKIEDGLPKWHIKLRLQEQKKIDQRLSHPNVFFVPNTKVGKDVSFAELINHWGFTAVLLANGAWQDRPLPVPGADQFVGKGLIYQNELVKWFNHKDEDGFSRNPFFIPDNAIVIGGGLASLDVVKIIMLETVYEALKKRDFETDMYELEQETIAKILGRYKLSLEDLNLKGCTLYYRRKVIDMPLSEIPDNIPDERKQNFYNARLKILNKFQQDYLFQFRECAVPTGLIIDQDRLVGLRISKSEIVDGKVKILGNSEQKIFSPLVVSSIGSIPEPISGIPQDNELYKISDVTTGQVEGFGNVFAIGNVVTGKGNIKASSNHGKQVAEYLSENFLAQNDGDYEQVIQFAENRSVKRVRKITENLDTKSYPSIEMNRDTLVKIGYRQKQVGYKNDYSAWIKSHSSVISSEFTRTVSTE